MNSSGVMQGILVNLSYTTENLTLKKIATRTYTINDAVHLGNLSLNGYFKFILKNITLKPNTTLIISVLGNENVVNITNVTFRVNNDIIILKDLSNNSQNINPIVYSKNYYYSGAANYNGPYNYPSSGNYYSTGGPSVNYSGPSSNNAPIPPKTSPSQTVSGNLSEINDRNNTSHSYKMINGSNDTLNLSGNISKDPRILITDFYKQKLVFIFNSIYFLVFMIIIILILSIILLMMFFGIRLNRTRNLANYLEYLTKQKIKTFVNKNKLTLRPNSKVLEALDIFIDNNIPAIPVMSSGSVIGIVTKMDIIARLNYSNFEELEETKIKDIMNDKFLVCSPDKEVKEILNLLKKKDHDLVIIEDKSGYLGTIDYFDLLKIFFDSPIILDNSPTLAELVKKVDVISPDTSLEKIKNKFLNKQQGCFIVKKDDAIIGILSIKDIIEAIKKQLDFNITRVITIMSPNIVSMTPGNTINEAFNTMIKTKFNQIPVIMKTELVGIVSVKDLLYFYYDLLKKAAEKKSYDEVDKK